CAVPADCSSGYCQPTSPPSCYNGQLFCAPSSCHDGIKDGTETDVDCGGSCLTGCARFEQCNPQRACDCARGFCYADGHCDCVGPGASVPCSGYFDCCTGICSSGQCVCAAPGYQCRDNADCCTDVCASGVCACLPLNASCQRDTDCCGPGVCSVNGMVLGHC